MKTYFTIEQIKEANKKLGQYFFSPDTMRFFKSKVYDPVISNMFITSEVYGSNPRHYRIRKVYDDGYIINVNDFKYKSKKSALADIKRIAKEETNVQSE